MPALGSSVDLEASRLQFVLVSVIYMDINVKLAATKILFIQTKLIVYTLLFSNYKSGFF